MRARGETGGWGCAQSSTGPIQMPLLGSSKSTHRTVLQISASDRRLIVPPRRPPAWYDVWCEIWIDVARRA